MAYSAQEENFEKSKGMENYRLEHKSAKSKAVKKAKEMDKWRKEVIKVNHGNPNSKDLKGEARRVIKENY